MQKPNPWAHKQRRRNTYNKIANNRIDTTTNSGYPARMSQSDHKDIERAEIWAELVEELKLGRDLAEPLYGRVRDAIAGRIAEGSFPPDMRLPTVRALAAILNLNARTVARAFKELGERGLIEANRGGGSHVARPGQPRRRTGGRKADSAAAIAPPGISSRLFELARAPGVIAFTGNYPSVAASDAPVFQRGLAALMQGDADRFFRYDPPGGRDELREALLPFLSAHGLAARPDSIIITSGGQQGLDLVARLCLKPGDSVIVEQPCYFGIINVIRAARAKPISLPVGPNGLDLDAVRDALRRHRPRLIVVNPTFQNPTGYVMPEGARQTLVDLANEYATPILEDDHCPELRYRGHPVLPLRAMRGGEDAVFYTRGFGKVFVPGIRTGFLIAPRVHLQECLSLKATTDLQSPALLQGALADYFSRTDWPAYLERLRGEYRRRQEALHAALTAALGPDGAKISRPDGGLSLWLALPEDADTRELYFNAVRRGVAFAVADSFSLAPGTTSGIRIAFGLTDPAQFAEGVDRLAAVLRSTVLPRQSITSAMI